MLLMDDTPRERPVREAEENLRIISGLMERSTKHSTFSGLSGVMAGLYSIAGCAIQAFVLPNVQTDRPVNSFLILWALVAVLAIGTDYFLTKRKAALVGKTIRSRLGKQMLVGAAPGLGTGALLTLFLSRLGEGWPLLTMVYPLWMLCYGTAVCSVGLFSQKEVSRLGWAFIGAGTLTLLVQLAILPGQEALIKGIGLFMTAVSFGGFHIVYGIAVSRRDGW